MPHHTDPTTTFKQWYDSLDCTDRPQFVDMLGPNGRVSRIIYSTDYKLWDLSDYVVYSRDDCLVHLIPRI